MTEQSNLSAVQEIYAAFGRGDVEAILDRVTDDVDWSAEAASGAAPWYGRRTGKEGVARFFRDLAGTVEVTEFAPVSLAATDREVHALVRFGFRSAASGRQSSMNLHHYWRFGDDGKVEYYRGSEDTEQTAATLAP